MRLKPSDLSVTMPPMEKAKLIAEVNSALELSERVDQQIEHWSRMDISDLHIKIMQDELEYLKRGKV